LKLPNVEKAVNETALVMMHQHLLGSREHIKQMLQAIQKVNDHLNEVKSLCQKPVTGK